MASHLTIYFCQNRRQRFIGRQKARTRTSFTFRNRLGKLIELVGHREMRVSGHWIHQDLFYKNIEQLKSVDIRNIRNHWERFRYDWMELIRMPHLEVGPNTDSSGYVKAISELFAGRVLTMINDEFIADARKVLYRFAGDCQWTKSEFDSMLYQMEQNKGKRAFAVYM